MASRKGRHLCSLLLVSVLMGVVASGLVLPVAGLAGLGARAGAVELLASPTGLDLEPLPQRTEILDARGDVLAHVFEENRTVVPLARTSTRLRQAVLSIEDYRFYQHGALDLRGTLRALLTNVGSEDVVQGGSTITQQLVKQTLVTQADSRAEQRAATERSYTRKLMELRYAIAMEDTHSKDWILERYLNTVYLGGGAYGVEAAAQRWFSVRAADLDLGQSALIAGMIQSPAALDPSATPDRARARRDVVLARMAQLGVVTERRARQAQRQPLGLDPTVLSNGCVDTSAPFFCAYALRHLATDPDLGATPRERTALLRSGGLRIHTTLEPSHQAAADASVSTYTDPTDQAIGALAMVRPGTGAVTGLAQSRPMGGDAVEGETFLNFTVPHQYGDSNGFQAGSTFKAFVLAAAIEQGVPLDRTYRTPDEMVFDQADFANCPGAPPFGGTFVVGNRAVASSGTEDLYSGTRNSINTFFLQLTQETGVCEPFRLAKEMGVRLTSPEGSESTLPERTPIFPLGVVDASPLEMAEAYATFAARGLHCDSRPVSAIRDGADHLVKEYEPVCEQVMAGSTADAVNDVLRGVLEGGFAAEQALSVPSAGKTGNNEGLSVWFAGHTPHLAAAAMLAGADEAGNPTSLDGTVVGGVPIYGASGSAYAAPIWGDAMKAVDDSLPPDDFTPPVGVSGVQP
ncbi:transglycosylase domain-containing protein [uncultured Nocardioides sp.]|uniref:transglycosylase domain-containing protein n=1 Tax=uncultured Nocardioides sp. TaxID=198441 RepID=UPI002618A9F7|nr:transglycosylase domain-containing protein [uncultured Nocardioides sp.]